jgi:hypothetical protein
LTKNLSILVYIDKVGNPISALIDSGAMGNFIHEDMVHALGLKRQPGSPLPLLDIKGLKIGELKFQVTVHLHIGSHEEKITMDVAPIRNHWMILGLP